MASVVFGGGITNVVGSMSGNTFARNKGGSYVKKKTHGTNPRSASQMVFRTQVGHLSKLYSFTLTDAQRAAWRTFAATNPTVNRLGNTTFLTGQQAYAKFNSPRLASSLAPVATPPLSTAISGVTSISLTATHDPGGVITVTVHTTGLTADERVFIYLSPPMNPGRAFISSQLRRMNSWWNGDTPVIVTSTYTGQFGSFPTAAGQRIFARAQVVNITNGVTSAFLGASFLWT